MSPMFGYILISDAKKVVLYSLSSGRALNTIHYHKYKRLSRELDTSDWQLNPRLFRYLNKLWGPHTIDRFATMALTCRVCLQTAILASVSDEPHFVRGVGRYPPAFELPNAQ